MGRSAMALALLLSFPAFGEETLAMLVVDGKAFGTEPRLIDPEGLRLAASEWQSMGLVVPKELAQLDLIPAQDLGVGVEFDSNAMEVRLTVPALLRHRQYLGARRTLPDEVSPAPKGVMVDYDIAVASVGHEHALSVGHSLRTNLGGGVLVSTGQANYRDGGNYIRGSTSWQRDFLSTGTTVQLGDVSLPRNGLNNDMLLGGVRVGTDRALTRFGGGYDMPMIGGLLDTRSTAEVFINEYRRATGQLAPGPYELAPGLALPGLNNLELVQRDAFGREQVSSRSFYAHPDMLTRGRWEWGLSVGAIRPSAVQEYYGGRGMAGTVSRGMTDFWTAGMSFQAGEYAGQEGRNTTVHSTLSLGTAGLIQAHVSASQRSDGASGRALRLDYERRTQDWAFSASHSRRSEDYWELSQLRHTPFRIHSQTSAGLSFHRRGGAWRGSINYTAVDYGSSDIRQLSATLSNSKPGRTFSAGIAHDLNTGDNRVFATLRVSNTRGGQTSYIARSAPFSGPEFQGRMSGRSSIAGHAYHYNVGAALGENWQAYARIDTTLAAGSLSTEVRANRHGQMFNSRYANSVWLGEGGVLNGRGYMPQSSFVLVEVPGQAGLNIRGATSRPEQTNGKGYALLTGLPGLVETTVQLNPLDVPLDIDLSTSKKTTTSRRGGGSKVVFDISESSVRQYQVRLGDGYAPKDALATSDLGETFALGERGVLVLSKNARIVRIEHEGWNCELVLPKDGEMLFCQP